MGFAVAPTLLAIAVLLFLAVEKGWIDDRTLQRLAHVAGVTAFVAALVVFGLSKVTIKPANENSGVALYPDSQYTNVLTGEEDDHDSTLETQKEDNLLNEVPTKGSVDSAESVNRWKLIIYVSRELRDFSVFVDGELVGTAHTCTFYVPEGKHTIKVNYENELGHQFEYSTDRFVAADMTLSVPKSAFTSQ